ncbi:Pcc1-domain-containing protein [Pluteus cervinus]|uniref:Pcc1-domain-containing protein n=1 Tax=Pluteus cervinus TaxID=181527 RepID=A0ACD3B832_9AGAR|nr:Pcc1-domain-containing protein [Pluteus cervinus]
MSNTDDWHKITLRIPFASPNHALIAKQVIEVDAELQPQAVKRELSVDGDVLVGTFTTLTVRLARLTVNAFLENVELVVRTLQGFGEDAANGKPVLTASTSS